MSGATSDSADAGYWVGWLAQPKLPLFKRAYDAVGFYALLDQAGISAWSVLPAMLKSQLGGVNNVTAYNAGTAPARQEVLDEWGSSYERDSALGLDWDLTGPGIVSAGTYGGPPIFNATVANDGFLGVMAPAYAARDYHLTSAADVVEIAITGTSRLKDSASFERVPNASGNYCTKQGGCTCPPGSAYQGTTPPPLTGLVHLALTGGSQGATGIVTGLTLQQFCSKQKTTTVPPVSLAFCQHILSLAEANQIMQPPIPASTINNYSSAGGGSCNYTYAWPKFDVAILLLDYDGTVPIPL